MELMTAPPAGLPKEVCVTGAYLELFHHNYCVLVKLRLCFVSRLRYDETRIHPKTGRLQVADCSSTANCNCKITLRHPGASLQ